jgi:uncharacterized protein YigA (DUF484 family)
LNPNRDKNKYAALTEETVLSYLQDNPNFFLENELVLSRVILSHNPGDASSLMERQINSLRSENRKIQSDINSMVKIAEENHEIFEKTKSLSLSLFEVDSWRKLNEVLATQFLKNFKADYILCNVITQNVKQDLDHIKFEKIKISENLISGSEPACLQLRSKEMKDLFGKPHNQKSDTESVILIPFEEKGAVTGVLSIGSHDPNRFSSDLDTLFAAYISSLIGKMVYRLCE